MKTYKELLKIEYSNFIDSNKSLSINTDNDNKIIEDNLIKIASYNTTIITTITEIIEDKAGNRKKRIRTVKKELPPDFNAIKYFLEHNHPKYKK